MEKDMKETPKTQLARAFERGITGLDDNITTPPTPPHHAVFSDGYVQRTISSEKETAGG